MPDISSSMPTADSTTVAKQHVLQSKLRQPFEPPAEKPRARPDYKEYEIRTLEPCPLFTETDASPIPLRTDYLIPTGKVFSLDNLLSREECQWYIDTFDNGAVEWDTNFYNMYRKSDRACDHGRFYSTQLAQTLFDRIAPMLKRQDWDSDLVQPLGLTSSDPSNNRKGIWRPSYVSTKFAVNVYREENHFFNVHRDHFWIESDVSRSMYSMVIYLNEDFEGGDLKFYHYDDGTSYDPANEKMEPIDTVSVRPVTGQMFCFNHDVWHEALPPRNGSKYMLRANLMFERMDAMVIGPQIDPLFAKTREMMAARKTLGMEGDTETGRRTFFTYSSIEAREAPTIRATFDSFGSEFAWFTPSVYANIFGFASCPDVAACMNVSRGWKYLAGDENVWKEFYLGRYGELMEGVAHAWTPWYHLFSIRRGLEHMQPSMCLSLWTDQYELTVNTNGRGDANNMLIRLQDISECGPAIVSKSKPSTAPAPDGIKHYGLGIKHYGDGVKHYAGMKHYGGVKHYGSIKHYGGMKHYSGIKHYAGGIKHYKGVKHYAGIKHYAGVKHYGGIKHYAGVKHYGGVKHYSGVKHYAGLKHYGGIKHYSGIKHYGMMKHYSRAQIRPYGYRDVRMGENAFLSSGGYIVNETGHISDKHMEMALDALNAKRILAYDRLPLTVSIPPGCQTNKADVEGMIRQWGWEGDQLTVERYDVLALRGYGLSSGLVIACDDRCVAVSAVMNGVVQQSNHEAVVSTWANKSGESCDEFWSTMTVGEIVYAIAGVLGHLSDLDLEYMRDAIVIGPRVALYRYEIEQYLVKSELNVALRVEEAPRENRCSSVVRGATN